jgi:hypothetical protein
VTTTATTVVFATTASVAALEDVPSGVVWCVTVADIDRNDRPVSVDSGPPGSDGKCSVPPMYSGLPATDTLIGGSETSEPSKGPIMPTSPTVEFSLLSSIKVLAISDAPQASSGTLIPSRPLDPIGVLTFSNDNYSLFGRVELRSSPATICSALHDKRYSSSLGIFYNVNISISPASNYPFDLFSRRALRSIRRNSLRVQLAYANSCGRDPSGNYEPS